MTYEITVVNKRTHKPTEYDWYIGRGSPLGNPYTHLPVGNTKAIHQCTTREEAIKLYRHDFYERFKFPERCIDLNTELEMLKRFVKDKKKVNLVCYCAPASCHGDVIKEYLLNVLK